jgi:hypothetical protein
VFENRNKLQAAMESKSHQFGLGSESGNTQVRVFLFSFTTSGTE